MFCLMEYLQSDIAPEATNTASDSETKVEKAGNFDPEKFYRICLRLRNYLSVPPAALAPALKFPEVFVLITVRYWVLVS